MNTNWYFLALFEMFLLVCICCCRYRHSVVRQRITPWLLKTGRVFQAWGGKEKKDTFHFSHWRLSWFKFRPDCGRSFLVHLFFVFLVFFFVSFSFQFPLLFFVFSRFVSHCSCRRKRTKETLWRQIKHGSSTRFFFFRHVFNNKKNKIKK